MRRISLEAHLDGILREDLSSVVRREQSTFDQLVEPFKDSLVLFGAGQLGREVLACLRGEGIEPLAFSDNNPSLWNKPVEGLPVLPPHEATRRFGSHAAFIVSIWHFGFTFLQVKQQLADLHCAKVIPCLPLLWKFSDKLLPHYCLDLPQKDLQEADDVRQAFRLWADETSRRHYLSFLNWRMHLDFDGLPAPIDYYPEELFTLSPEVEFVDCGAFDGDTIDDFIRRRGDSFGRIIAVEPDPSNFQKLKSAISAFPENIKNKICALQAAVGVRRSLMHFDATGTMASAVAERGGLTVDCVPLDELLKDSLNAYVKIDVEGAELDALNGAASAIERASTIWAVTTEHRHSDLWRIPLFIHSLSADYNYYLRPHSYEGLDLVCYAIPRS